MAKTCRAGAAAREAGQDLEVWRVELRRPAPWVQETAERVLSADERARAERAAGDVRRRRLVTQIALRLALARRLGRRPESLAFRRGPLGKPELDDAGRLRFSVAHSGDCCLIALTTRGAVGVDVEHVAPLPELDRIVAGRFAPCEAAELERLPGPLRLEAFYRCWTRKEAYLKATGAGLTGLGGVAVSAGERPQIRALDSDDPAAWAMRDVRVGTGLVGSVAVRGHGDGRTVLARELPLEGAWA